MSSSVDPGARAVAFVQAASAAFLPVSVPVRTWISGSATDCTRHRHIPSPGSSFLPVSAPEAQTSCGVCLSTGPTGGGLHRFILRVAYKFLESTISRRSSFKQGSAIADDMEVRELSAKLKSLHLEHKPCIYTLLAVAALGRGFGHLLGNLTRGRQSARPGLSLPWSRTRQVLDWRMVQAPQLLERAVLVHAPTARSALQCPLSALRTTATAPEWTRMHRLQSLCMKADNWAAGLRGLSVSRGSSCHRLR